MQFCHFLRSLALKVFLKSTICLPQNIMCIVKVGKMFFCSAGSLSNLVTSKPQKVVREWYQYKLLFFLLHICVSINHSPYSFFFFLSRLPTQCGTQCGAWAQNPKTLRSRVGCLANWAAQVSPIFFLVLNCSMFGQRTPSCYFFVF